MTFELISNFYNIHGKSSINKTCWHHWESFRLYATLSLHNNYSIHKKEKRNEKIAVIFYELFIMENLI